jgi:predicted RNA binding protein YcfA (HicA-like mRNA interferase family)
MGSVPVLKPAEVCRRLEVLGFARVRQRGSHVQFRHADGRGTTVPMHKGRDINGGDMPSMPRTAAAVRPLERSALNVER